MQIQLFDKFQIPNDRGKKTKCQICAKSFSVFNREHQCKRCVRAVCNDCKSKKKLVYLANLTRQEKGLCITCSKQSDYLQSHIQQNKLVFGQASETGTKWSKKVVKTTSNNTQVSQEQSNDFVLTKKIFAQLWNSYNYSLRQFIGILTMQLNQDEVFQKVQKVYEQLIIIHPTQKMENIIYIIIFSLCYCNPEQALNICSFLLDLKRSIIQGRELLNIYLKHLGVKEDQNKKMSDYLKYKLKKFVPNFSINNITAEGSIYIISRALQRKKIDQLFIFMSIVIEINKDTIINSKSKFQSDLSLIQNCNLERIINKYKILASVKTHNYMRVESSISSELSFKNQQGHKNFDERSIKSNIQQSSYKQLSMKKNNTYANYQPENSFVGSQKQQQNNFLNIFNMIKQTNGAKKEDKIFKRQSNQEFNSKSINFNSINNPTNNLFQGLLSHPNKKPQCDDCKKYIKRCQQLQKQLQLKNSEIEDLKSLTNKSKQVRGSSTNHSQKNQQQSSHVKQQTERLRKNNDLRSQMNEKQIRKLKAQNQNYKIQSEKNAQMVSKYRQQLQSLKNQVQQSNLTNKMLKNKIDTFSMSSDSKITSSETGKIQEMLRSNLLEKNLQIQNLMKQNKILAFQLEDSNANAEEISKLKKQIIELNKKNQNFMAKISQLSNLVIQQETQKLQLAQSLFEVKEARRQTKSKPQKQNSQCTAF